MAGPSLHKGSCIDPAARGPQDHIKLDLVHVYAKELWATEPKTLVGPSPGSTRCAVRPAHLPLRCAAGVRRKVVTVRCREFVLRRARQRTQVQAARLRGHIWPKLPAQRPCGSGMEHKRFQLGLSAPKLGAGVSPLQASEVNCSPLCGEDEREGGQKH